MQTERDEPAPDDSKLASELLGVMDPTGVPMSNQALQRGLAWDEPTYHRVRDLLIARGALKVGPGRGGTVRLVVQLDEVEADKNQLVEALPRNGRGLGKANLLGKLGWTEARYEAAKQAAMRSGELRPGRGRGEVLRRATPDELDAQQQALVEVAKDVRLRQRELELYPEFETALRHWIVGKYDTGSTKVVKTAHQGRPDTGGTWTRPDFMVLAVKSYIFTPGKTLEIETFEVKTAACGIEAVFETAAHSRSATRSYLAIHREDHLPTSDTLERIESECERFGLGLILFDDPADFARWVTRVKAVRREPDPEYVDASLSALLGEQDKQDLQKWIK